MSRVKLKASIKTASEIARMQESGRIVEDTLKLLEGLAKPGITTAELDREAEAYIRSKGAVPSFLGYGGYPKSICTSVNEQVVHGIPGKYRLKDGDVLSIDVGAELNGWHGDAARTLLIGNVSPEAQKLAEVTRECFFEGLKYAKVGYRVSDIGKAVQQHAEAHGYGVVRDLVGHGIGRHMHEEPDIPNFYAPGLMSLGMRFEKGMTVAIEPMISMGTWEVRVLQDGWTIVTLDGLPSAHYENTVAITEGEPVLLTCGEV
jgi:methionyl aminopeptidase